VLNRALPLSFYVADVNAKSSAYNLVLHTLSQKAPKLHEHLTNLPGHDADAYLEALFAGLFTRHLALDEATRLWDVFVFEGDTLLIRACVAYLLQNEMSLLGTRSIAEVQAVLGTVNDANAKPPKVLGGAGEEERWMQAVREAGKI
jgi:hypothetical protein